MDADELIGTGITGSNSCCRGRSGECRAWSVKKHQYIYISIVVTICPDLEMPTFVTCHIISYPEECVPRNNSNNRICISQILGIAVFRFIQSFQPCL